MRRTGLCDEDEEAVAIMDEVMEGTDGREEGIEALMTESTI